LLEDKYYLLDPNPNFDDSSHTIEGEAMRSPMKDFVNLKKLFTRNMEFMKLDLPPPLDKETIMDEVQDGEIQISK
jgi:hypothetical protein